MDAILSCQGLTKLYGQKAALVDFTYDFPKGIGSSASWGERQWKNDAVKACSGLLTATRGSIRVCGLEPGTETKKRVSFLPERSCLPAGMRVREALEFFGDFYADFQLDKAAEMLKDLQIQPNDKLNALSKGTREKLQLALVIEPQGGALSARRADRRSGSGCTRLYSQYDHSQL